MKGRARSGELILAKDRKTFFEAEATLIRKRQLAKILPAVPFLVSPSGDLFLCIYDDKKKVVVRWTVTGVEKDSSGLTFTARKEIRKS